MPKRALVDLDAECSGSGHNDEGSMSEHESDRAFVTDDEASLCSSEESLIKRDKVRRPPMKIRRTDTTQRTMEENFSSASSRSSSPTGRTQAVRTTSPAPVDRVASSTREAAQKDGGQWKAQGVGFFLTFPRNGSDKEGVFERIVKQYGRENIRHLIIGHEKHQDGTDHLHLVIVFTRQVRVNHNIFMEWMDNDQRKSGDYKFLRPGPRNLAFTYTYCGKEDDYVELNQGTLEEQRKLAEQYSRSTDKKVLAAKSKADSLEMHRLARLSTYENEEEQVKIILDTFPHRAISNLSQIKALCNFYAHQYDSERLNRERLPWKGVAINKEWLRKHPFYDTNCVSKICHWLNNNINEKKRPIRTRQLYIVGRPGCGKTTFLKQLESRLKLFAWPRHETFVDGWCDFKYQVATIDEFGGGMPFHTLLHVLDGGTYSVPQKGKAAVMKRHNIPFIICSNKQADACYTEYLNKNPECLGTLSGPKGRLLEVRIEDGVNLADAIEFL